MKRTQRIDLTTTIASTFVSFVAITMFVALGVGLFLGIHWVGGSAHSMMAEQLKEGNAHDIEITFPYGLTAEHLEKLSALDEGLTIESGRVAYQEVGHDGVTWNVRVGTLPREVDTFFYVEGELPNKPDQIALEVESANRLGFAIGDKITFVHDGANDSMRFLQNDTYTVTALVKSPAFLAKDTRTYGLAATKTGSVDALSWVVPEAFNQQSYLGGQPYIVISSDRLKEMDPFSDEYREAVKALETKVSGLGGILGKERVDQVRALAEIVKDGRVNELEQHTHAYEELSSKHDAAQTNDAEYDSQLDSLGKDVQTTIQNMGIDIGTIDHTNVEGFMSLTQQGMSKLGINSLDEARSALGSIADYSWIVLSRPYNGSVILLEGYAGVTANMRWSMASLFLVVGLLVCYSAISRIVHEQVTTIGTKKALGFEKGEVLSLFECYAALCVILGVAVGVGIAVFIVEPILLSVLSRQFVVDVVTYANALDVALIGALEAVLILGAAWIAVSGVIKRQAVDLLAGERPLSAKPRFYESWGIWKRMGLLAQTTVNNCVNDRRRVVGTLIGVAGCTALIACAITLNDNVMKSVTRQYAGVTTYTAVANVETGSRAATEGAHALADKGMDATAVFQRRVSLVQPDGVMLLATVTVPIDTESFGRLFSINAIEGNSQDGGDGAWVSEAYHEHLGAQVGDVVMLVDEAGNNFEIPIAGFFEWHLMSHQVVVSNEDYQKYFGTEAHTNKLLVNTNGKTVDEVDAALSGLEGYGRTQDDYASNQRLFNSFSRLARIVVAVYLGLAVVMAACVLLNLDFMFVAEKKRELIVLMICGYSQKDAKGYVWHDSVFLTAIGIICGLALGGSVGSLTVRSIEQANASFLHGISWTAMGIAILGTVVLATAAQLIALRRVSQFDLTDINRF